MFFMHAPDSVAYKPCIDITGRVKCLVCIHLTVLHKNLVLKLNIIKIILRNLQKRIIWLLLIQA